MSSGSILAGLSLCRWYFAQNYFQFLIIASVTFFFMNLMECPYFALLSESIDKQQLGKLNVWVRVATGIFGIIMTYIISIVWKFKLGSLFIFITTASILIIPYFFIIPILNKNKLSLSSKLTPKLAWFKCREHFLFHIAEKNL